MLLSDIIQIILAIITFVGIIVACLSTKWSVDKQNKQILFEIRSKSYTVLSLALGNYNKIKDEIHFSDVEQLFGDALSDSVSPLLLTAIGREMDEERASRMDASVLSSCIGEAVERIEYSITEIPLLFSDAVSSASIGFLKNYRDLILKMHDYVLLSEKERQGSYNATMKVVGTFYSLEKISKDLSSSCKRLAEEDILKKMEHEIKLQKQTRRSASV